MSSVSSACEREGERETERERERVFGSLSITCHNMMYKIKVLGLGLLKFSCKALHGDPAFSAQRLFSELVILATRLVMSRITEDENPRSQS